MPVKTFTHLGRFAHETESLFLWTTSGAIYVVPMAALAPYKIKGISKSDLKQWKSENEGKLPGIEFAGIVGDYHIMDGAEGDVGKR